MNPLRLTVVGGPGRWARFYVLLPAATLAATRTQGQIKLFLSRTDVSNHFVMLGEGAQFNSTDNSSASRIDMQVIIIATGPQITADVWHEIQVYEWRDPVARQGTVRVWYDGKFHSVATSPALGDDDPTLVRGTQMGMVWTQLAGGYPIEVFVDDVTIANGYIDPP